MPSINKVFLIGNLGAAPVMRHTSHGDPVCTLSIATTERFKDRSGEQREVTEWHRVVLFRRLAEIADQYLATGAQVYIEGSLKTRKWQDAEGRDRYTTEIEAHEMKMLGSARNVDEGQRKKTPHPLPPVSPLNDDEPPF